MNEWVKKELDRGWQSNGYNTQDQKIDSDENIFYNFCLITIPVILGLIWAHQPNRNMNDWACMEVGFTVTIHTDLGLPYFGLFK